MRSLPRESSCHGTAGGRDIKIIVEIQAIDELADKCTRNGSGADFTSKKPDKSGGDESYSDPQCHQE
jgi:hypothetical protein